MRSFLYSVIFIPMKRMLTDDFGRLILLPPPVREPFNFTELVASVTSLSSFLSTSLGPCGLDKVITTEHGDVEITNDGATILKHIKTDKIPHLISDLAEAQDNEIGDGTTSVVVLAGEMLKRTEDLVEKGVHRVKIIKGLESACELVCKHLESIAEERSDCDEIYMNAARTTLNSKIVTNCLSHFARVCVDAALIAFNRERMDLSLEHIRVTSRVSCSLSDTKLVRGTVLMKEVSHPQMHKSVQNARIALLACPFEPPKIKTKHTLRIKSETEYKQVETYERDTFISMIQRLKDVKTDVVLCQWGFDDEANSLLAENGILAVRWVGGSEIEQLAVLTNGSIISRFEDLKEEDLGMGNVHEECIGTEKDKIIVIENDSPTCTIIVQGGSETVIEEAKRSVRDALCSVRNILMDKKILYGGGSVEVCTAMMLRKLIRDDSECLSVFAGALEEIPMSLARNAGHDPIKTLGEIRAKQRKQDNINLGVGVQQDCDDMKVKGVFDSLSAKIKQYKMATQMVTSILKIDDMIVLSEE